MEFSRFNGYDIKDKTSRELLEALREEHDTLKDNHDTLRSEHDSLKDSHDTLRGEHDSLRGEHDTLRGEHDTLRGEHDNLRCEHDNLRGEHDNLKEEYDVHSHTKSEITDFAHGHNVSEVVGAVSMELIWNNPSPTSTFNAQDIAVDTTGFDGIEVVFQGANSSKYIIGGGSVRLLEIGTIGQICYENSAHVNQRYVAWTDNTKLSFNDTREVRTYGNIEDRINSNNSCIPIKVYGIKGVQ